MNVQKFLGLILILPISVQAENSTSACFYVSPSGSDAADGSRSAPFSTLVRARDAARKGKETKKTVVITPGNYFLSETFTLDSRDNGLTIRAEKPGTASLYGGAKLTGWYKDGDRFWAVDLPEVKTGKLDFRALEVNGELAPRACYPDPTNRLENLGTWNIRLLPALAGWWERKPTYAELTEMPYKPGDLPKGFDAKNAEVRLYHMWSESLCGIASNNTAKGILYLSSKADWPMGACGRKQYVIYNIREGMTAPGQWYLDRTAGKLVYWPKPGEDMTKLRVVAPHLQTIISLEGKTGTSPIKNVTLEGITLSVTTPPLQKAGFGGRGLPAALHCTNTEKVRINQLTIRNVGGMGCQLANFKDSSLSECEIQSIGACGIHLWGNNGRLESNHIHHVGLIFPSSSALSVSGTGHIIRRNEVHDVPYSGMIVSGERLLVEENLIYRVMQTLHDGAAIYGNISESIIRGNIVRDVVPNGKGYGASAYYIDEGGHDTIVEENITEGVPTPVHNHITRNIQVRNNTFLSSEDMTISFQNSSSCRFEGNTLFIGGKLSTRSPNAIKSWSSNRVFTCSNPNVSRKRMLVGNAKPENPQPPPRKGGVRVSPLVNTPAPIFDGEVKSDEWPGLWSNIDRDATRRPIGGSPAMILAASDAKNLYLVVSVTTFRSVELSHGHDWGKDDGVQIDLDGKWVRGFIDGTVTASDPGFRAQFTQVYAGLAQKNRGMGKLQYYAFTLPLSALHSAKPLAGTEIPFNVSVFSSAYREFRYWEGGQPGKLVFPQ